MTQYSDEEEFLHLPKSSSESESDAADSDINDDNSDQDQLFQSDSDSDAEPECFSFSATQENRKQTQKLAAQAIKLQKDELKRKRKEILLQNIKQREEKRQKLVSKRLPDEVLENLDDEFDTVAPEVKKDEPEITEKEEKESDTDIIQTSGNIIFKCKVLPPDVQRKKYIPKKVANFKEQMLYGSRIKREKSTRNAVLKKEKQQVKR